jgi:hypothetical protein
LRLFTILCWVWTKFIFIRTTFKRLRLILFYSIYIWGVCSVWVILFLTWWNFRKIYFVIIERIGFLIQLIERIYYFLFIFGVFIFETFTSSIFQLRERSYSFPFILGTGHNTNFDFLFKRLRFNLFSSFSRW